MLEKFGANVLILIIIIIIIIIIIYSLFNEGDVINPMSYLTYGLRQPDGID